VSPDVGPEGRQAARPEPAFAKPARDVPRRAVERLEAQGPVAEVVANAGLVLLHPHLVRFLGACGVLDERQRFRDAPARHAAVHALHHLATGEIGADEHVLALPRLLCACAEDEALPRTVPLDDTVVSEAAALLAAVIGHWRALRSTSLSGLRETFIRRPGLLELRVERRGVDVLLDALPWGLSVVRLPWMRQPLHVEWA
jgi:hypothetical protein